MPEGTITTDVLNQVFMESHRRLTHSAQRMQDANDNIGEQTKLMFLTEQRQVGTREAAAIQRLDTSKIAQEILQNRAASDQPQKKAD